MTDHGIPAAVGAEGAGAAALRALRRLGFGKRRRAEAWQLLADALEGGGVDLGRTMEAVAEGYALSGRKAMSAALLDIRGGIGSGRLAGRLARWCGPTERILFDGLGKQNPGRVFAAAARLLRSQLAMRDALLGAVALPALLAAGFLGLVLFFGLSLLPALADVADLDALPPFQGAVVEAVLAFSANPLALALWISAGAGALALAARSWTGFGRVLADRVPPFSLVRLAAGSAFLFAVVECGRSGQAVTTRLIERMAGAADPYGRSRIRAIARLYAAAGGNLGEAALLAGQGFPALELAAVLRALWNRPGGIERVGAVLERWLARVEDTARARMAALNAALLAAIAAALVALMSIALPVVDQVQAGPGF